MISAVWRKFRMNLLFSILLGSAGVLLIGQAVNLFTMRQGDGFSRSMAVSFGGLTTCLVWLLIAVLLGMARTKAAFPSCSGWVSVIMLPFGLAAMMYVNQLMRSYEHSRWLIVWVVIPAVILLALAAAVRFGKGLPRLESARDNVVLGSFAILLAVVPLFVGRKRKR